MRAWPVCTGGFNTSTCSSMIRAVFDGLDIAFEPFMEALTKIDPR